MTTIYVNGNERTLLQSVGWLNYDRVVMLSQLPYRYDYVITYAEPNLPDTYAVGLGSGVMPLEGMRFFVANRPKRPWWYWLWPS